MKALLILMSAFFTAFAATAFANPNDEIAGQVVAEKDGKKIIMPLLSSDYEIDVVGTVATVQVTQSFSNSSDVALNAEYLFPLNRNAAVFSMKMEVGNEVIEAVIQEKNAAKRTFEKAKSEGKAASLLTQHRPNMFTQNIANLMPGLPIKVTLSYVQTLPKVDGSYTLVVPMIVAPRYGQVAKSQAAAAAGWQIGDMPAYPDVAGLNLPKDQVGPRVTLSANLRSGLPIMGLGSETHKLAIKGDDQNKRISFKDTAELDNRDFVMRYSLEGDSLQAGVLGHFEQESGYASITVEPPKIVPDAMVTPRELIFLMDTSGSQDGQPIAASKKFMNVALAALRPEDHFRIIQFENTVTRFSDDAMPASVKNIKAGQSFVRRMVAGGGTDIDAGIEAAFGPQKIPGTLRIVVFLSDGLVGNEGQVIKRIRKDIGDARIYSFGVGASVNRYLMDGVATQGRGYARYIDPTDDASEVAVRFASNLKTPVLTDISVDWGDLKVMDATPARLPDLFEGGSVSVLARYKNGGKHTVTIKGKVNGVSAALPMEIDLPSMPSDKASNALPLIWARNRIAGKTLDYNTGMGDIERLKDEVIDLGLKHSLQSQFTSFVAVSKVVYNAAPDKAVAKSVALPKVAATSAAAYPSAISGSSTPEPETWLGILLALALGTMRYWWRFWATLVRRLNLKGGGYHASI